MCKAKVWTALLGVADNMKPSLDFLVLGDPRLRLISGRILADLLVTQILPTPIRQYLYQTQCSKAQWR